MKKKLCTHILLPSLSLIFFVGCSESQFHGFSKEPPSAKRDVASQGNSQTSHSDTQNPVNQNNPYPSDFPTTPQTATVQISQVKDCSFENFETSFYGPMRKGAGAVSADFVIYLVDSNGRTSAANSVRVPISKEGGQFSHISASRFSLSVPRTELDRLVSVASSQRMRIVSAFVNENNQVIGSSDSFYISAGPNAVLANNTSNSSSLQFSLNTNYAFGIEEMCDDPELATPQLCDKDEAEVVCDDISSPLVVDLANNGFAFTSSKNGVKFDIDTDGKKQVAWTTKNTDDAFLVFDRNENGEIDSGAELFGDSTPISNNRIAAHGFAALKDLDSNNDDIIDSKDSDFAKLWLWTDSNKDGRSNAGELKSISRDISSIQLKYEVLHRVDAHGNKVLSQSTVKMKSGDVHKIVDIWFTKEK